MKTDLLSILELALMAGSVGLAACTTGAAVADVDETPRSETNETPDAEAGCPGTQAGCPTSDVSAPGDDQTPPVGDLDSMRAWLADGTYQSWTCEPEPHPGRTPSPHQFNRICSNAKMSAHEAGEYPLGAANVKELYAEDNTTLLGHAFYVKVASGGAESWYWFEEADGLGLVASSRGDTGAAKTLCAGCHAGAPFGFVFTKVK